VFNWDKRVSNGYIRDASFDVKELLDFPGVMGLYAADEDGDHPVQRTC